MLGQGSFSTVYLAEHKKLNASCAVKCFSRTRSMRNQFLKEADVLSYFSHPSIPKLYEKIESTEGFYLIEEYARGESLDEYVLHHEISVLFLDMVGQSLCDFFSTLLFSRKRAVFYMDMKPEHMIVTESTVKVIDYGAVLDLSGTGRDTHLFGNREYDAPELVYNLKCRKEKAAVYSIGAILSFLLRHAGQDVLRKRKGIVQTATQKNPEKRYETIEALKAALVTRTKDS